MFWPSADDATTSLGGEQVDHIPQVAWFWQNEVMPDLSESEDAEPTVIFDNASATMTSLIAEQANLTYESVVESKDILREGNGSATVRDTSNSEWEYLVNVSVT